MCFHFPNGKGFVFFFPFSEKYNCKQKCINKNLTVTTKSFSDEVIKDNEIYIKLLICFRCQESMIDYNKSRSTGVVIVGCFVTQL